MNLKTTQTRRLSVLSFLAFLLFLCSCSSSERGFQLEGRFKNLNHGEFYIYHPTEGWKDTITVHDGRFTYRKAISDTITLRLIFPNFSEMPIFAMPNARIKMEGDASHLRATEIEGTDDNEEMTGFRLRTSQMTPPEVVATAEKQIRENPQSLVSIYLLRRYFLEIAKPDFKKAYELCQILYKSMPQNREIEMLVKQLSALKGAQEGDKLPTFKATDMEGKTITNAQLKAEVNVVLAWASWNYDSKGILTTVRKMEKTHGKRLAVVSICIDANTREAKQLFKTDSITWPNICDGQMWQTDLMQKMGFGALQANVIADKNGKVLFRNLASAKEMETKLKSLLK